MLSDLAASLTETGLSYVRTQVLESLSMARIQFRPNTYYAIQYTLRSMIWVPRISEYNWRCWRATVVVDCCGRGRSMDVTRCGAVESWEADENTRLWAGLVRQRSISLSKCLVLLCIFSLPLNFSPDKSSALRCLTFVWKHDVETLNLAPASRDANAVTENNAFWDYSACIVHGLVGRPGSEGPRGCSGRDGSWSRLNYRKT
jgi:hypothetical protein